MAVFAVAMTALFHTHVVAAGSDGRARRVDRATTIGQDLLSWLHQVPYDHALLEPGTDTNDGDLLDQGGNFNRRELEDDSWDFSEEDILDYDADNTSGDNPCDDLGTNCEFRGYIDPTLNNPSDRPTLDFTDSGQLEFERYWLVAEDDTGKRISVIVRWYEPSIRGHRRVVMYGFRHNPALMMQ